MSALLELETSSIRVAEYLTELPPREVLDIVRRPDAMPDNAIRDRLFDLF